MASLFSHPSSPYWSACFLSPNGRTTRSTKIPVAGLQAQAVARLADHLEKSLDLKAVLPSEAFSQGLNAREARRLAQRIADAFEDAARQARVGQLSEIQARKVIGQIFSMANQDQLPSSTIREFLNSWLKRKEIEANERTHERYESAMRHVLNFLGSKANRDISHLNAKEISALRDFLSKKLSPNSANFCVKVLRAALNQARRDGLTETNEASRVTLLQRVKKFSRRPFTMDELKKILNAANNEWRGMILVGLYTGLRLGDIALLTWTNLDLEQQELTVLTQKTGRRQIIPLVKPLLQYIESLPSTDDPTAPLFPNAHECKVNNPHGGPLSNQFYNILVGCGFVPKRTHQKEKEGRSAARKQNELSFHCLRHTATSLLKNAGVSDVIARDIIGHESEAVSANYTHNTAAIRIASVCLKLPVPSQQKEPAPGNSNDNSIPCATAQNTCGCLMITEKRKFSVLVNKGFFQPNNLKAFNAVGTFSATIFPLI